MNKTTQRLNREVDYLMPDSDTMIDAIWDTPVVPMTEPDDIVMQTKNETTDAVFLPRDKGLFVNFYRRAVTHPALSFALCLLLIVCVAGGTTFHATYAKPDTVVAIDVNPSVELTTNRKNQVIQIDARNEDAETILDGMELKHVDLNIAVNAIIGSMLKHGYLCDDDNVVLISVSNKEPQKADTIKQEITEDITSSLAIANRSATVLQQDMENDDKSLKATAERYHITVGKVQLINEILAVCGTDYSMDELADYSTKELAQLADRYGLEVEQTTSAKTESTETKATSAPVKKRPDTAERTPAKNNSDDSTEQTDSTTQTSEADSSTDSERDYEEPGRISNADDGDTYDDEAENADDAQLPAKSTTSAPSSDEEETLPGKLPADSYEE